MNVAFISDLTDDLNPGQFQLLICHLFSVQNPTAIRLRAAIKAWRMSAGLAKDC
jgi:hypothetical protein